MALTGSSTLLVPSFFEPLNIPWIPNPLDDQHQAGAIAWGVGEVPSLFLALLVTLSWMRSDEAEEMCIRDRARTSTGKRRLSAIPTYRGTGTEATAAARTDPVDTPSISASGRRPRRCASVA